MSSITYILKSNNRIVPKGLGSSFCLIQNASILCYKRQEHLHIDRKIKSYKINFILNTENYDAFKDEIIKIQKSAVQLNNSEQTIPPQVHDPFEIAPDPFGTVAGLSTVNTSPPQNQSNNFSVDWSNTFDQKAIESNSFGANSDPFASDPFQTKPGTSASNFDDMWANQAINKNGFQKGFISPDTSTNDFSGFGNDDNWATTASITQTNTLKETPKLNDSNPTNTNDSNNWANFDDGIYV